MKGREKRQVERQTDKQRVEGSNRYREVNFNDHLVAMFQNH